MKKILLLAIGFALMSSAIIFLPEASRDAYHSYLLQKINEDRGNKRFSERSLRNDTHSYQKKSGTSAKKSLRNLRYPTNTKRYLYSKAENNTASKATKPVSLNIGLKAPGYLHASGNRKLVTKPFTSSFGEWTSYQTPEYVLEVPVNAQIELTEKGLSFDTKNTVHVSIKKITEKSSCIGGNFYSCARGIMSTENSKKERQIGRSNEIVIERKSGYTNNFSDSNNQSEFFLKTSLFFSTKGEQFVTQKVVRGMDGTLFLVDISSSKENAYYAIPFAKEVFDSFHISAK